MIVIGGGVRESFLEETAFRPRLKKKKAGGGGGGELAKRRQGKSVLHWENSMYEKEGVSVRLS